MVALTGTLGVYVVLFRKDFYYGFTIIWALIGIISRRLADHNESSESIIIAAGAGILIILLLSIFFCLKRIWKNRTNPIKTINWLSLSWIVFSIFENLFSFSFIILQTNCTNGQSTHEIQPGACQTSSYFPMLQGKRVAIVANHTATIDDVHLVDSLVRAGIEVKKSL